MFSKAFRVKGNTSLKNSEKKSLVQKIQSHYPNLSDEDAKVLLPNKAASSCMKIVTQSDITFSVYTVDNVPMVIEAWDKIYPTIYTLWKCPNLLPKITIHRTIVKKLQNGAPLFLPGVNVPYQGRGFPEFSIGQVIGVNTEDNSSVVLIGTALMSSADMLLKSGGTCVETIQILGDFLCKEVKSKLERPQLDPPPKLPPLSSTENITEEIKKVNLDCKLDTKDPWPSLGPRHQEQSNPSPSPSESKENTNISEQILHKESGNSEQIDDRAEDGDDNSSIEDDGVPTDVDGLLKYCLLSFLKMDGKRINLPLKTNLLYRNHMVPLCPAGRTLDVKKSSYKKMSKFLSTMEQEGLLVCKEIDKGVDAVVGVDLSHPDIKRHVVLGVPTIQDSINESIKENEVAPSYVAPQIKELFSITAAVLELFAPLKKGTTLTSQEVRGFLTEYVKRNNLQDKSRITPNAILTKILGSDTPVSWEQMMISVMNKMSFCNEMLFPDGTMKVTKGKLDPIQMLVATRSGNKKVTLVSNLEVYGVDLATLSKECQHGVAASSTITRTSGAKYDQLLVQGNQTIFLAKHLVDTYGIPKKYIEVAEKAMKKQKK